MQKKGKLNQNPLRQQTCLRIGDFSFLAIGELGLKFEEEKKSQLLVCFSSSLGIPIVYIKKKWRKKESLVEVFKKIKVRKLF